MGSPRLYWGFLDGRASPKKGGKWSESGWRLCDRYLPYALGGGYVLGGDLVPKSCSPSPATLPFPFQVAYIGANAALLQPFANEDVSVGAWLAGLAVAYVHEPRFDVEFASRGCDNRFLIAHKQTPDMIKAKWASLRDRGKLCETETRLRPSYDYNWAVPPSLCCQRTNDPSIP